MWVRSLGQKDPLMKGLATSLVFLPGESHGQSSLVGYSPRGHRVGPNTTEQTTHAEDTDQIKSGFVTPSVNKNLYSKKEA